MTNNNNIVSDVTENAIQQDLVSAKEEQACPTQEKCLKVSGHLYCTEQACSLG